MICVARCPDGCILVNEDGFPYTDYDNCKGVLVLLDGHKINSSANGIADLSSVPVAMIERIEVHKSGASAQFGPDAMGGVVSIITQPSGVAEPTSIETETSRSSWHTQRYEVVLVNPLKSVTFGNRVAISDNSSHGDFDFTYHASPVDTVFYGPRLNNRSTSRNYFLGGRWQSSRTGIGYSLQVHDATNGLPGPASRPTQFAFREDDRLLAGVRFEHQLSSRLRTQLSAGSSRFVQFFRDRSDPVINQYETRFTEKGLDVKALFEWRSDRYHRLQVGGQIQRNSLDHVDYMREANATGKTVRRTYSAFVLDRHPFDLSWTKLLDDVTLSAALRYDNATTTPEKTAPRYPWEKPRQTVRTESWSPRFGVTVSRGERLRFVARAAWGESLRLPSINALFWKGDARSEGNPDLRPERSRHLDGGIELTGRTEQFEFSAGITVYRKNVEDLVEWVRSGPQGVFKPVNLGAARITGHEDFITLKLWKERLVISYGNSITHALNKQPGYNSYDKWLTYSPRYVTTLGIRLNHRLVFVSYRVRGVARRYALSGNEKWYDGYTLQEVGLGTQVNLTSRWRLQLDGRLRNAGDEEYVLISKHPMSGREYSLSMKLTFTPREQKK
jgi:iron complex outermembrane receptor protein